MNDYLDVSSIGLDPEEREKLVSSIMDRVARSQTELGVAWVDRILAEAMTWARPAVAFATAATVVGFAVLSSRGAPVERVELMAGPSDPVAEWIRTGDPPTPTEMLVQLATAGP